MKISTKCLFSFFFLGFLLIMGIYTPITMAQEGPPSPEDAFEGHTFDENYWDVNIFNNSYWDHPEVDDMRSWLNNTWNVKWIREGNFEMGMLAFLNHSHIEEGVQVTYVTPAQMWWQHAYLNGSEIWIGSMHCAWFGFADKNNNNTYDDGEEITPFFYMGTDNPKLRNEVGIISNPKTIAESLERTVDGSTITYRWGYNYTDIVFFVPRTNRSMIGTPWGMGFEWGFNYSDPGSYIDGSHVIGNQTYVYYEYTLEVDTTAGIATLYQNYEAGDFGVFMARDNQSIDAWYQAFEGDEGYMPDYWAMCLGTWSFIYADQDWALTDLEVGEINATVHKTGLTEVRTTLGGFHAFDFRFSQKPTYDLAHINGTDLGERDALYECLDVNDDHEFISFVSGMLPLVGEFGRLMMCYAINQTNHFTHGIPFDDVWYDLKPNETAAFFITCYPDYGEGAGGKLIHDPVFQAYFSVGESEEIYGYSIFILSFTLMIGVIILITKTGAKYTKNKT